MRDGEGGSPALSWGRGAYRLSVIVFPREYDELEGVRSLRRVHAREGQLECGVASGGG